MSVLRSIIQNDSVRLLLISLFAHLFGIIPYARQHCPYSFYYAGDSKLLLKNVLARQDRADQMADLYWRDKLQQDYRNLSDPWSELAVVVITTKRQKMDYLKRTLAAINENLIVKSQLKTGVMVCNTDIDFKSHGAVKSVSFAMTTYNVYQFRKKSFSNDLQKETHDFSICLNESLLHFRSDFFLVMEDDMIVLNESAKRLNTILAQLRGTEWTALKLFYPLTYQGYELTIAHVVELIVFSSLITGFVIAMFCSIFRKRGRETRLTYLALTLLPIVIGTFLLLGRQHSVLVIYHYLAPNTLIPFPAGSTGAIVFARDKLSHVIRYLDHKKLTATIPIDFILRDYFHANLNEAAFLVQENLLAHVGFSSSIPGRKRNPKHFYYYA